MAGRPLTRARREEREAQQLADLQSEQRAPVSEPRDTPADYSDDLIPDLLALASQGYSRVEIAAHWAVSEETVGEWEKAHKPFADALSHARTREKAWWMGRARKAIRDDNNRFPAGAWSHVMRARFAEYDDKPGLVLDIGQLVVIQRRQPELTGDQSPANAMQLISHRTVRLPVGPTVAGSVDPNLPDVIDGQAEPVRASTPAEGG